MSEIGCITHLLDPLQFTFKGKKYQINNKLTLIVHSFIIGLFTFGLGGVLYLYVASDNQKLKQLRRLHHNEKKKAKTVFSKIITSSYSKSTSLTSHSSEHPFLSQFDKFDHTRASLSTLSLDTIHKEFEEITALASVEIIEDSCGFILANGESGQDRFSNNFPWEHTRVKLQNQEFLQNSYINASWITLDHKKTIAAQGPTFQTALSFWHMVSEYDIHNIIMLTSEHKSHGFCYWPQKIGEECCDYLPYRILLVKEHCTRLPSDYRLVQRKFQISQSFQPPKFVYHFQIPDWPDFGVIDDPQALLKALALIQKKTQADKPDLIHCTAGLGRTGTLQAILHLLNEDATTINVAKTVAKMRLHRPLLVQTPEQYQLIFQTLSALPPNKKSKVIPEVEVCIDFSASKSKQSILSKHIRDKDGCKIASSPDEPLVKLRCFYGNKKFTKKFDLQKLCLPISLFDHLKENDILELQYKKEKFRLRLSQTSNVYGFENQPFENYLPSIRAKTNSDLKTNPFAGYKIKKTSCLFHLLPNNHDITLQKVASPQLRDLEAPEVMPCLVSKENNVLLAEVSLPSAELQDIDVLVTNHQLIIYAKMKEKTFEVNESNGEVLELNLQNEYFASFFWREYSTLSFKEFVSRLEIACTTFNIDELKIKIDLDPMLFNNSCYAK